MDKFLSVSACCKDFDIDPLDILFPERLNEDGQEFLKAHGLWNVNVETMLEGAPIVTEDGKVKIYHVCDQLTPEGLCKIYANRPNICRNFDCKTRVDCVCKGTGKCQI